MNIRSRERVRVVQPAAFPLCTLAGVLLLRGLSARPITTSIHPMFR